MAGDSAFVSVTALLCNACGAEIKAGFLGFGGPLGRLRKSGGRCPSCGKTRFFAIFTVKRTSTGGPDADEVARFATVGCVFGWLWALVATGFPGGSTGSSSREYELDDLEGEEILARMSLPLQQTIEWLVSVVREAVKADLAPHQGLCLQCGEIYVKSVAGRATEGYCSPVCRKKHQKDLPPAVGGDTPAPAPRAMDCPHCGRKIQVKPGGRCMYCGQRHIQLPPVTTTGSIAA